MRIGIEATVDVVFKKIYGTPGHSRLTLNFLNDLLPLVGRPRAITVEITNPYRLAEFKGDKEISVDVRAKDETKRNFQVEMQVRPDASPSARMLDNWARIYSDQIQRGDAYGLHRPAIAVWILAHELFPGPEWLHRIEAVDLSTGKPFGRDFLLVVIELAKRASLPDFDEEAIFSTGLDRWLALLTKGQDVDLEDHRYGKLDPDIREALEIMDSFTKSERARLTYDRRKDWESRVKGWREMDRAEGKAEGKAEGLAEAKREAARNLKQLGVSSAIIAEAIGLSVEDVEGL